MITRTSCIRATGGAFRSVRAAWLPILLVGMSGTLPVAAAEGGDPEGGRNRAAERRLPEGPGLAAAFPADEGIGAHPAVAFADGFERTEGIRGDWDEEGNRGGDVLALVPPPDGVGAGALGGRCLKVTARLGRNNGGGLTKWFDPPDTVFIRFHTRFDGKCDYVHHFCTLRANRGLQGGDRWSGFGGAGELPDGARRFSTALEPWGNWGRFPPPGRWNFYSYWHEMTASPDGKFWGNSFRPAAAGDIPRGQWISCEFMLRHNTPGQPDGEQAFWIDGRLAGHWTGINWRTDPVLRANAFTLESYVTDRWTKNPENVVYFDNVVVASEYIGPSTERSGDPEQPGEAEKPPTDRKP